MLAGLPALIALSAISVSAAAEPNWIWSTKDAATQAVAGDVYFRRAFDVGSPSKGSLEIAADNRYEVFVNGRNVGSGDAWQTRTRFDISSLLVPGRNLIAVRATNDGAANPAGLVAKAVISQDFGKPAVELVTDADWKFIVKPLGNWARLEFDDSRWEAAAVLGVYGKTEPWGAAGKVQAPSEPALANKPRAREPGFFDFKDGDRVVFLGSAFIERMQSHGYLEAMITAGLPERNITFRNLGWSGDTVWGDARAVFGGRAEGFKRLLSDINLCNPTVIIVCYGENEAYAGEAGLEEFRMGLNKLLDALEATGARLMLWSPRQHESLGYPLPDATEYNAQLRLYRAVIADVARAREHAFVDLYDIAVGGRADSTKLTSNGIHLNPVGEERVARHLLPRLGVPRAELNIELDVAAPSLSVTGGQISELKMAADSVSFDLQLRNAEVTSQQFKFSGLPRDQMFKLTSEGLALHTATGQQWANRIEVALPNGSPRSQKLLQAIAEKNALFFNRHRPQNETYLFLFRKHEQGNNAVEIPQFDPLIAAKEKEIAELKKPVTYRLELKAVE